MPSPFPGMNPYLEHPEVWHDFHERFIPLAADWLGKQVLPRYFVKIDEHLFIHEPDGEKKHARFAGRGDVAVTEGTSSDSHASPVQTLEAPARVRQPALDYERISFLEIHDRRERRVITVLKLLSPSVKRPGRDRDQYLAKCAEVFATEAHLIEIDLLRSGHRLPWQNLPACEYYVVVSSAKDRPDAGIWPIGLRDPLPEIPIPLLPEDADAKLDLQAMVDHIYDVAGYEYYIYDNELQPPLSESDAAWATELVATN